MASAPARLGRLWLGANARDKELLLCRNGGGEGAKNNVRGYVLGTSGCVDQVVRCGEKGFGTEGVGLLVEWVVACFDLTGYC